MHDTAHKTDRDIESAELIFGSSPMPAAVVDRKGNILYKNAAFEKISEGFISGLPEICGIEAYEGYIFKGGRSFKAFAAPLDADGEKYIVNMLPYDSLESGFMTVMSACVRKAAGNIASASDNIVQIFGTDTAAPLLNEINEEMSVLLSEILIPEQILLLRHTDQSVRVTVSLSESMEQYADEIREIFPQKSFVKKFSVAHGIFTAADVRAIRLVLTDFFASGFEFERCMEGIHLTLERCGPKKAAVTLSCGHMSPEPQIYHSRMIPKPDGYSPAGELMDILHDKFGCEFAVSENPEVSSIRVTVPEAEPKDLNMLKAARKRYAVNNSFSDEKV
ncbi:MAG: hypothetical protein NC120_12190, partial [Ruminococcus sp.]|nr:hypothetical protein [Ruminococcus sp.]